MARLPRPTTSTCTSTHAAPSPHRAANHSALTTASPLPSPATGSRYWLNACGVDRPSQQCPSSHARRGLTPTNAYGVNRPTGRYQSGLARRGLTATRTRHVRRRCGSSSKHPVKTLAHDTLAGSRLGTCHHVATSCRRLVQLRCRSRHVQPPSADVKHSAWTSTWD